MTTLPNMGLVLPTRGPAGAGTWDDTIDADLALTDDHDHTTGKGLPITTAAIEIDADLSFSSLWAPKDLHRITFASIASLVGDNKSLFVKSDNELYWKSNAGAEVKLTTGSALNIAAFTGGFGGDYAAVGAAAAYDDAGDRYTFKQQAPGAWARLASGEVRLFETGTTENLFVGLSAPAALASSYTITLPTAAPASTLILQMDSSGVVTASNATINGTPNFTGAVTFASSAAVATSLTVGTTLGVTGVVTLGASGDLRHGARELVISAADFQASGNTTINTPSLGDIWSAFGAPPNDTIRGALSKLRTGDRIISITWHYNKASQAAAMTMKLRTRNGTTNTDRDTLSDVTSAAGFVSLLRTINYTLAAGDAAVLVVQVSNVAHQFSHAVISYDHP